MADHFLGKIRVTNDDFVEADGAPVLERHEALRSMLVERAGPEVAEMFAEPLISRGNDEAPPTVSWYSTAEGTPRPLDQLWNRGRSMAPVGRLCRPPHCFHMSHKIHLWASHR